MKWKTIEKALLLGCILTVAITFSGFAGTCETLPNEVLRLHVLANSDSEEDQALKLAVRDRILQEGSAVMDGVSNKEDAIEAAKEAIPALEKAAQEEIRERGYSYPVSIAIEKVYFPTRQYGDTTLPAGKYDALRVVIGSGEGHNWWCVLFPALCLPAAEDTPELSEVLTPGELDTVQGGEKYEVRFKLWEMYEWVRENWFS
jgi:stage II sporulation protein R